MAAYRFWRLMVMQINNGGNPHYCIIGEMELHATVGGVDITTPGTVITANSRYDASRDEHKIVDNNTATYWQSGDSMVGPSRPASVIFDLGSAVELAEYTITCQNTTFTCPSRFSLQASSDGAVWPAFQQDVADQTGWQLGETRTFKVIFPSAISGTAKLDTGVAASRVLAYQWDAPYAFVGSVVPNVSGEWALTGGVVKGVPLLVVTTGPSGYQPIAHGPIVPG